MYLLLQGSTPNKNGVYNTTKVCNENPNWIGDNYCDDATNNEECEWDGGDCCGSNVNTNYCTICECIDPTFN